MTSQARTQERLATRVPPFRRFLILPAFNEEEHLGRVLDRISNTGLELEVVVVDDGSSDRTARIGEQAGVLVLRHPLNLGYGAALQTGYKHAYREGARLLAQMDADGQHDPADLIPLIEHVEAGFADLVIGSRFLGERYYRMGFAKSAGRWLLRRVARALGLSITDPTSGLQVMNRKVLATYISDIFPTDYPDLDILLLAHRLGLRIAELPVQMSPSPRSSYLHSGLAPIYYLYRMALSIWAGASGFERSIVDRLRRENER